VVKERLIEETAKGNWSGALGLGALGIALSIGIVPMLIIILGLLAVGVVLIVYLLPVVLAAVVGGITFFISKKAGLTGIKLVGATLMAALGSLVLFSCTDFTLWGMSVASNVAPQTVSAAGRAQLFGIPSPNAIIRILQLMLGVVITGFVLLALLMLRSVGASSLVDATVGLFAAFFVGIIASSLLNFQIPGLATGVSAQGVGMLVSGIIGFAVGSAVMYSSWKWD